MSKLSVFCVVLLASSVLALAADVRHSRAHRRMSRMLASRTASLSTSASDAETAFLDCAAGHSKLEDPDTCKDKCYWGCYTKKDLYPHFDVDQYVAGLQRLLTSTKCNLRMFDSHVPITAANFTAESDKTALKGSLARDTFVNGVPEGASWEDATSDKALPSGHALYRITVQIGAATTTKTRADALFDVLTAVLNANTIQPSPVWFKFFTPHAERADTMIFMYRAPPSTMEEVHAKVQSLVADLKTKQHVPIGTQLPPFQYLGAGEHKGLLAVADYQGGESFGYKLCNSVCHVGGEIRSTMLQAAREEALAKAEQARQQALAQDPEVQKWRAETEELARAVQTAQEALNAAEAAQPAQSVEPTPAAQATGKPAPRPTLRFKKALILAKTKLKQHEDDVERAMANKLPVHVGSVQIDNAALTSQTKTTFQQKWSAGHNSISSAWTFADPTWPRITKAGGERHYRWS